MSAFIGRRQVIRSSSSSVDLPQRLVGDVIPRTKGAYEIETIQRPMCARSTAGGCLQQLGEGRKSGGASPPPQDHHGPSVRYWLWPRFRIVQGDPPTTDLVCLAALDFTNLGLEVGALYLAHLIQRA